MKKIIISLAIIGMVAGITLGVTGAYWTGAGTSTNTNSFRSGTLDLQLAPKGEGGTPDWDWQEDVTDIWNYENMAPGENPVGGEIFLRNHGTIKATWLKFDFVTTNPDSMGDVMKITELKFAGKNLLIDGLVNGDDDNGNEFADLEDLDLAEIIVDCDSLLEEADSACFLGWNAPGEDGDAQALKLMVQLDVETSDNDDQGGTIGLDVVITMGQGPVPDPTP